MCVMWQKRRNKNEKSMELLGNYDNWLFSTKPLHVPIFNSIQFRISQLFTFHLLFGVQSKKMLCWIETMSKRYKNKVIAKRWQSHYYFSRKIKWITNRVRFFQNENFFISGKFIDENGYFPWVSGKNRVPCLKWKMKIEAIKICKLW